MSGGIKVRALGAVIGLEFDETVSPDDVRRLETLWKSTASSAPIDKTLTVGIHRAGRMPLPDVTSSDIVALESALSTRITLAAIEQRKYDLIMLHACGVALDDGTVVAFVGPSGRGKTTLARTLGQHYAYVTDETVGIDAEGTVHPHRKPLSVITDPRMPQTKSQIAPESLALRPLTGAELKIGAIVLLNRDEAHEGAPAVEQVASRDAIPALVPELSYLPELPDPLLRLARLLDEVGGVKRVTYREAASVPEIVPHLVGIPRPGNWRRIPLHSSTQEGRTDQFTRIPVLDQLELDGEYLILSGRHVHALDGIGPAIWDALADPCTLGEVTEFVVARHGVPGDSSPTALVDAALKQLRASGLLAQTAASADG